MQTEPVVTRYSADAAPLLAELEKIRAAQAKYGASVDQAVGRLDQQNKQLENSIAKWAKVGLGIAAISKAIDYGGKAWEAYGEQLRLTEAAAGVNIDALDRAVGGQLEHMELLKLAAELNNGALKLTQEQMEDVAGAVRQLAREGEDATEVAKAMANFIGSGQTKALVQYGIGVDEAGKKTKNLSDIFREIKDRARSVAGETDTLGESQRRMSVDVKDAFQKLQTSIGEFVAEISPAIKVLADALSGLASAMSATREAVRNFIRDDDVDSLISQAFPALAEARRRINAGEDQKVMNGINTANAREQSRPAGPSVAGMTLDALDLAGGRGRGGGGKTAQEIADELAQAEYEAYATARQQWADERRAEREEIERGLERYYARQLELDEKRRSMTIAADAETGAQLRASIKPLFDQEAIAKDRKQTSVIEGVFGPLAEFNRYAAAFDMLTGAVSSAMGAWIDGSMSAGAAAKAFIRDSLKGIAQLSIVEALKNTAYGFAALALGPIGGTSAAAYFKAAALHGATAVAAGLGAKAMSSGGASAGAAQTSTATGGGSGGGGRDRVVVIGDPFAEESHRMRQRRARNLVALADGGGYAARAN